MCVRVRVRLADQVGGVTELDGCVVEPAEDGFVSLFERRIGRAQPHRYVILSHEPEVRPRCRRAPHTTQPNDHDNNAHLR